MGYFGVSKDINDGLCREKHTMSIYSAYIEHILKARGKNEEGAGKERGKKNMRRNTA